MRIIACLAVNGWLCALSPLAGFRGGVEKAAGRCIAEGKTTKTELAPATPPRPAAPRYRLRTIVLDAGHGGKDRGCAGQAGARESAVALKIILALGRQIEAEMPDVRVLYTRKTDVFIPLDERAEIANRNHADLFVSVHCNAAGPSSHGTEVWTMGPHKTDANLNVAKRENSVILQEGDNYRARYGGFDPRSPQSHIMFSLFQSAYVTNSLRLAQRIDRQFRTAVGRPSRGVKQAGFIVLWRSTMPSVLIEVGFLTNPTEERFLNNKAGQTVMASGILRAFREYKRELEGASVE
ncbi:N-acetylmuramoyl-L-alanine amidase [uncultured Hymenobacter sp.]|uniref:N-acetylmuramoyl-L-alanine amidase family protein n=1 Tax=uncultured Hymenobacter sp. TaxID=170016 RepID=UPI0035CC865B